MYPLMNTGATFGLGRVGKLVAPMLLEEFILRVKVSLGIEYVSVAGNSKRMIKKVAVCGGSGAGLMHKAAFAGADVLVTGDVKYHEAQDALDLGITIIDAGHFATEQPIVPVVGRFLEACNAKDKWGIDICLDTVNKDVFHVC